MAVSSKKVSAPKRSSRPKSSRVKRSKPTTTKAKTKTNSTKPTGGLKKTKSTPKSDGIKLSSEAKTPEAKQTKAHKDHIKGLADAFGLDDDTKANDVEKSDKAQESNKVEKSDKLPQTNKVEKSDKAPETTKTDKAEAKPDEADKDAVAAKPEPEEPSDSNVIEDILKTTGGHLKTAKDGAMEGAKFIMENGDKLGRFSRKVNVNVDQPRLDRTSQFLDSSARNIGKVAHPLSALSNGKGIVDGVRDGNVGQVVQSTTGLAGDVGGAVSSFRIGGAVAQQVAKKVAAPIGIASDTIAGGRQLIDGIQEGNVADTASGGLKIGSAVATGAALALSGPVGWAVGGAAVGMWAGAQVIDNWDTIKGWFS